MAGFSLGKHSLILIGFICWTMLIFLVAYVFYDISDYLQIIGDGYGVPCSTSEDTCSVSVKHRYEKLRTVIRNEDFIVSSNPQLTNYYLGRANGYFRERNIEGNFSLFNSPTDEYLGIQLIDSREEIENLSFSEHRVWFLLHEKSSFFVSKQSLDLLEEIFTKYEEGNGMVVYVNHPAESSGINSRVIRQR